MEEKKWAYEIVNGKAIIPQGTKKIVPDAFKNCKELTSVEIPEGVTHICKYAFNGCERLQDVTLPESLEYIDDNAFGDCKSLGDITIGNNIKGIARLAFNGSTIDSISCFKEEPFDDLLTAVQFGNIRKVIISYMANYAQALETQELFTSSWSREEYIKKFEDCGGVTHEMWKELKRREVIKAREEQREKQIKAIEAEEKAEKKKSNKQMICVAIVMLLILIYALLTGA